jgi:hypothetical protein
VLAVPAGKAIGIMDDTVAWGSNPAASDDLPTDHETDGAARKQPAPAVVCGQSTKITKDAG